MRYIAVGGKFHQIEVPDGTILECNREFTLRGVSQDGRDKLWVETADARKDRIELPPEVFGLTIIKVST